MVKNDSWTGSVNCNSGFVLTIRFYKVSNLVFGTFDFATQAGKTIPPWKWINICPAGTIPINFRPKSSNKDMMISLQGVGAGKVGFNIDGSIDMMCFDTFQSQREGGMQVIYLVD